MSTAPPTASIAPIPFIVPAATHKRVRSIAPDGTEEHADENLWIYMQLKDPFQQETQQDNATDIKSQDDAAADEPMPKPEEVISAFAAAKGELEWLVAMLTTLRGGRYLAVGRCERVQGPQRLVDLAVAANLRYQRRAAAAAKAATALADGAAALAALGQKEDAFYAQVAHLQRYWKVRTEPPDSPYAYSVDISLKSSNNIMQPDSSSSDPASEATLIRQGPVEVIRILKDPNGMLRVQASPIKTHLVPTVMLKAAQEPPTMYTGPAAIHSYLLRQLRQNAWHMVLNTLDTEITSYLGLPARMQPAMPAAAASRVGGSSSDDTAAAAVGAAVTAAPDSDNSGQQQPATPAGAPASHLTFYAALADLVLQAVIDSAASAGESSLLRQQQHDRRAQAREQAHGQQMPAAEQQQQQQQKDGAVRQHSLLVNTPGDLDLLADDVLMADAAEPPWETAAAAAAAAAGTAPIPHGIQTAAADVQPFGSSSVEPQLLSLRPLVLEHVLLTRLGHLVTRARDEAGMTATAFASAAQQQRDRQRERPRQQQLQSAASGLRDHSGGIKGSAGAFSASILLMMRLCKYLGHSSTRGVLRVELDELLQQYPGVVVRSLSVSHPCISACQLSAAELAAAAPNNQAISAGFAMAAAAGQMQHNAQRNGAPGNGSSWSAQQGFHANSVTPAPLLVLLQGSSVTLEGSSIGAATSNAAVTAAPVGVVSSVTAVQTVPYMQALPTVLKPHLDLMLGKAQKPEQATLS